MKKKSNHQSQPNDPLLDGLKPAEQAAAGALRAAYEKTPLPARSGELRDALDESLNQPPQPRLEKRMKTTTEKRSGLFVLVASLWIVGLVLTLMWVMRDRQTEVAEGDAVTQINGVSDQYKDTVKESREVLVPVVATDLPAGRKVRTSDIRTEKLSLNELRRRGFDPGMVMIDPTFIAGREIKRPIKAGEPFLTSDTVLSNAGSAFTVAPGQRTAQIELNDERGANQMTPNDRIDLYFTSTPKPARDGQPAIPAKTIRVADGVKALHLQRSKNDETLATLSMDPDVAAKVYALNNYGEFSVRPHVSSDAVADAGGPDDYTLASLLGIENPAEYQPPPVLQTEYWKAAGGRSSKRLFPIPHSGASPVRLFDNSGSMDLYGHMSFGAYGNGREARMDQYWFADNDVDGLVEEGHWEEIRFGDGEKGRHDEGRSHDRFDPIQENPFKTVNDHPLSTFSIDVDTASYSKTCQYLQAGQLPPADSVRIEELVNYFPYDYLGPMGDVPFAAHMEVAECPWRPEHRLARIAIKGREIETDARPVSNLVFLLDVSGSMNEANKLPLVKTGMRMLVEQLGENDRVAIVVYAGAAGLVLPSTTGDQKEKIIAALDQLQAGGSTAGAEGITLAYKTARENFIKGGVNRVLLCTDGDFNVGTTGTGDLVRLAEEQAKENVFLSILGFGMGNLNDAMLEQVSGKANGTYAFIDTEKEARKVLIEQLSGTLVTIAKDVKIQIEFNPAKVKGYRLIGYENRVLAAEDFNDDKKDAGEIGAGHTVTALYEIVPADAKVEVDAAEVDDLKYQKPAALTDAADTDELLTLKLRYKLPDEDKSTLMSFPVDDDKQRFGEASDDFQFAAAVASFGMLLRGSRYSGNATLDAVTEIAGSALGDDEWGYRKEFVELVKQAKATK